MKTAVKLSVTQKKSIGSFFRKTDQKMKQPIGMQSTTSERTVSHLPRIRPRSGMQHTSIVNQLRSVRYLDLANLDVLHVQCPMRGASLEQINSCLLYTSDAADE